jgi:hypothetical protein
MFDDAHYRLLKLDSTGNRMIIVSFLRGYELYYTVITKYWDSLDELDRFRWIHKYNDAFFAMEAVFQYDKNMLLEQADIHFKKFGHITLDPIKD